jgi:hypothetical protein
MSAPTDPLALQLARMEVKLDQLLVESGDHEARIRKLEERRWPLPVMSAVCSLIAVGLAVVPMLVK